MITTAKRLNHFFHNKNNLMTPKQKIYFIIQERKSADMRELLEITGYKSLFLLRQIMKLMIERKIKRVVFLGNTYFIIRK